MRSDRPIRAKKDAVGQKSTSKSQAPSPREVRAAAGEGARPGGLPVASVLVDFTYDRKRIVVGKISLVFGCIGADLCK